MPLSFDLLRSPVWFGPLLAFGLLAVSSSLPAQSEPLAQNVAVDSRKVAVELTFLKSKPGERERLIRYIESNWFAMDRIAQTRGLMDEYTLLETGSDEGPWNVLVAVTYRDERGYAGIRDDFEKIRAEHREVVVDGKRLRDLGAIVESKTTYARTSASSAANAAD
jgi:hypothetical protein